MRLFKKYAILFLSLPLCRLVVLSILSIFGTCSSLWIMYWLGYLTLNYLDQDATLLQCSKYSCLFLVAMVGFSDLWLVAAIIGAIIVGIILLCEPIQYIYGIFTHSLQHSRFVWEKGVKDIERLEQ
jgi:hypothetical protein